MALFIKLIWRFQVLFFFLGKKLIRSLSLELKCRMKVFIYFVKFFAQDLNSFSLLLLPQIIIITKSNTWKKRLGITVLFINYWSIGALLNATLQDWFFLFLRT